MGAHTLPGEYFTSREVYDQETDQIFLKSWICAGRASTIPNPGDFFLHEMDGKASSSSVLNLGRSTASTMSADIVAPESRKSHVDTSKADFTARTTHGAMTRMEI